MVHDRDRNRKPENKAFWSTWPLWAKVGAIAAILIILVALIWSNSGYSNYEDYDDDFASESEANMPLMMAINTGDADEIKKQLRESPELKEEFYGDSRMWGNIGGTLDYAIITGNPDSIQAILDSGVDVNKTDTEGRTALHQAASLGSFKAVSILIQNGAKVNAIDSVGFTPLFDAAQSGSLETTRILLEAGADSLVKTPDGQTAESIAREYDNPRIASLLAQTKAKENQ